MKKLPALLLCLGAWLMAACDVPENAEEATADGLTTAKSELASTQGAMLQGAMLQGAMLQGAMLQGAQFQSITLSGSALLDAKVEKGGLVAERLLKISGTTPSLQACAVPTSGDDRTCGFVSMGVGSCTPGQVLDVGGGGCGLGAAQGDTVMRVCAGTAPCEHISRSILGSGESACFGVNPKVQITCPSSGLYNVMAGAQVSGDAWRMSVEASAGQFPAREVLSGTQLAGVQLTGSTVPTPNQAAQSVQLRVAQVVNANSLQAEGGGTWDASGHTFLYRVEYYTPATATTPASWRPLCSDTLSGRNWAVPITGVFDHTGARDESNPNAFTLGCERGVIAKCYRWGYKPWPNLPNSAQMEDAHWACTRMARADYCGDGTAHTVDGTLINLWDNFPSPIQLHGVTPTGMDFEAGWNTQGAVCLSHDRWKHLSPGLCPGKLYAPGYVLPGGEGVECAPGEHQSDPYKKCASVCESDYGAYVFDSSVRLFNESHLNNALP
jgi:hypothetical protein